MDTKTGVAARANGAIEVRARCAAIAELSPAKKTRRLEAPARSLCHLRGGFCEAY
jgi:hypothetical protein